MNLIAQNVGTESFIKKLANYQAISEWEIQNILDFEHYEKNKMVKVKNEKIGRDLWVCQS